MNHTPASFDKMFSDNADPWSFETRWYEARKRQLTLASLPMERYGSAYEPGCANGVLTAALADRCDRLLATDGSPHAVDLARQRLAHEGHVEIRNAWIPDEWPQDEFDLVVISELGYFLGRSDVEKLAQCIQRTLCHNGTVVACHWRWKSTDCELDGAEVHRILCDSLGLTELVGLQDRDFLINVWSRDPRSVAQLGGIFDSPV